MPHLKMFSKRRADFFYKKNMWSSEWLSVSMLCMYSKTPVFLNLFDISAQTCRCMDFKLTMNISDIIINIS